jgi:hypothetical protein
MINIIQPKLPARYLPLKKAIKTKEKKFKLQGRYRFQKLPIAIENKAGSIRRSMPGEKPVWSNKMDYDYGFIVNTMASDGEGVDTYVDRSSNGMRENYHKGENDPEMIPTDVYVVHQLKIWHSKNWNNGICPDCHKHHTECSCPQHYDEDKVMLGFKSKDDAIKAYLGQYDSEMFLGPVSTYSIDEFHNVLKQSWGKKIPSKEAKHEHWHGFDLDGTLAKDDGWKGKDYIGDPIEKTRERIQKLLSEGKKVKLFTARASDPKAIPPIQQWMKNNNIPLLEITNKKDPGMISLEDDRAIQVRKNTGNLVKSIPNNYYLDYDRISNELYRGEFMLPLFFSLQDFMVRAEVLFEDYGRTGESLDDFINRTVRKIKDKMFMDIGQQIANDSEFKMKYGLDTRVADTEIFDNVNKSCGKDYNMGKSYLGQPGDQSGSHAMLRENLGESYGVKKKSILTMFGAMNEIEKCYPMEKNVGESLEDFTRRKLRSISGDHVQAMHDRGQSGELEKAFVKQTTRHLKTGKIVTVKAHSDSRSKHDNKNTERYNIGGGPDRFMTSDEGDRYAYKIATGDIIGTSLSLEKKHIKALENLHAHGGIVPVFGKKDRVFADGLSALNNRIDRKNDEKILAYQMSDQRDKADKLIDEVQLIKTTMKGDEEFYVLTSLGRKVLNRASEIKKELTGELEKAFVKVPAHTRKGKRIPAYTYFTDKERKIADVRHTKKTRVDYGKKEADKKIAELEKKKKHHDIQIEAAKEMKEKVESHKKSGNTHYKVVKKEIHVDEALKHLNDHIEHHTNEKKSHDNHIAKIKDRYKTEQAYWDKQRESRKAKEAEKKKAIDELVKDGKHGKEVLSDDVLAVLNKMKEEKPAEKKAEKKPAKEKTMDDFFKEYHAAASKDQKASIAKRAQDKFMKDNPDATLRDFLVASRAYKDKMPENKGSNQQEETAKSDNEQPKDYSKPIKIGNKTLSDIENNMKRIGKPPKGAIFKNDEKTYTVTKIGKRQPDGISTITFEVDNGNKKSEMRINYYGETTKKNEKKEEPIVERISFKAKGQDDPFHKRKKTALEFKLKESITKTHFKELMRLSHGYDPKTKTGYISEGDKDKFMELVDKMNRSNLKRARTLHARSIEKRKQKTSQRMSFNEWYEEADMPEKVNGEWIDRETGLPWKD